MPYNCTVNLREVQLKIRFIISQKDTFLPITTKTIRKGVLILKRSHQNDLENAAEKQRLKQLCKDFQSMIKTEDGARYFVFMMEVYNTVDIDSFIDYVSEALQSRPFGSAE